MKKQITPGMVNAMTKGAKLVCKECGMGIPSYPGAYPKICPSCGGEIVLPAAKISNDLTKSGELLKVVNGDEGIKL